ncbi:MAG: glycosyltransferase [Coriobacteriia bacterium]|nr:glycosyltransferase [Coriobacteriia bacterium]
MKIAYISDTYLPETNGIVTAIVRHSATLAERGHEFLVLCPRYGTGDPKGYGRIHIERYGAVSAGSNEDTHVALPWLFGMVRTLREFKPDIIHAHTPLPIGVTGVIAAKLLGVPLIQTYHSYMPGFIQYLDLRRLLKLDTGPRRVKDDRFSWLVTRLLYNRADLVLTPSRTLMAELRRHRVRSPVRYQTNGIELAEFPPKDDYALHKRIVHIGRLGYEKHADVVVRAFALFARTHPDWSLHILGEGPARPYLLRLAAELDIEKHVEWSGFIDRMQLAKAYRDADIFATASTIETQGIVVLEAMASGTPVVGVNALAVPEMAHDGRDGIIVEPYDAEAMSQAFARLADDDALRERMGRTARESVKAHLLLDAVDRLEQVYEAVAQGLAGDPGDGRCDGVG